MNHRPNSIQMNSIQFRKTTFIKNEAIPGFGTTLEAFFPDNADRNGTVIALSSSNRETFCCCLKCLMSLFLMFTFILSTVALLYQGISL